MERGMGPLRWCLRGWIGTVLLCGSLVLARDAGNLAVAAPVTLLQVPGEGQGTVDASSPVSTGTGVMSQSGGLSFAQYLELIRLAQSPQVATQIIAQAMAHPLTLAEYIQLAALARTADSVNRIATAAIPLCHSVDDFRNLAQALASSTCPQASRDPVVDQVLVAGAPAVNAIADVHRLTDITITWSAADRIVLNCTRLARNAADVRALQALVSGNNAKDQVATQVVQRPNGELSLQELIELARLPHSIALMNNIVDRALPACQTVDHFRGLAQSLDGCPCTDPRRHGVVDRVLTVGARAVTTVAETVRLTELTKGWPAARAIALDCTRLARTVADVATLQQLVDTAEAKDAILNRFLEQQNRP
jgi:hypothetical protein